MLDTTEACIIGLLGGQLESWLELIESLTGIGHLTLIQVARSS